MENRGRNRKVGERGDEGGERSVTEVLSRVVKEERRRMEEGGKTNKRCIERVYRSISNHTRTTR